MIGFYILLQIMGVSHWLSIIGAIAFAFSSNHFILYEAGHNSKIGTITHFALILAGFLMTLRKKYLLGGAVFALGIGLGITTHHVQMLYYLFLCLGVIGIFYAVELIKKNELNTVLKALESSL